MTSTTTPIARVDSTRCAACVIECLHINAPFAALGRRTGTQYGRGTIRKKRQTRIRFFDDIGYEYNSGEGAWARSKCDCDPSAFRWVFLRSSGVVGDDSRG